MDVVTLDGDSVNRKGDMSGGYHDAKSARLLTLENIRKINQKLKQLSEEHTSLQQKASQVWLVTRGQ